MSGSFLSIASAIHHELVESSKFFLSTSSRGFCWEVNVSPSSWRWTSPRTLFRGFLGRCLCRCTWSHRLTFWMSGWTRRAAQPKTRLPWSWTRGLNKERRKDSRIDDEWGVKITLVAAQKWQDEVVGGKGVEEHFCWSWRTLYILVLNWIWQVPFDRSRNMEYPGH